jgi:phospholipase/carboxylesterase
MYTDNILVIFFHGIGASAAQLMPLVTSYQSALPNARLVVPNAPFRHRYGYEWFSLEGNPLAPDRIQSARDALDRSVNEIVLREEFEEALDRVAFVGVSQGAIVSLDAVASGRWPVRALVSFAGLLPPVPGSPVGKQTPVLLVHGQDDATIPPLASVMAANQLKAAGFQVELDVLPGVGHTISPSGAERALRFLQKTLSDRKLSPISEVSVA